MFTLEFATDNAAFDTDNEARAEVTRILRDVAVKVDEGRINALIYDINGNAIGKWSFFT